MRAYALSTLAAALAVTPDFAHAAAETGSPLASSDKSAVSEEVVVTARRVDESRDRVPMSITVVREEEVKEQQIQSLFTLQWTVPGLTIAGSNGVSLDSFMRGVTGVQQYFAAVPTDVDNPSNYFDIASVQVLKGPQGTLFGLGNTAGAVLSEPAMPEREFGGWFEGQVGSDDLMDLQGVVNVPIVEDKVLLRLGGQFRKRDGFIHIVNRNFDIGTEDRWLVRASLTLAPTDAIRNTTLVNYYSANEYGVGGFPLTKLNPNGALVAIFGGATFDGLTLTEIFDSQKQYGPWKIIDLNGDLPRTKRQFLTAINTTEIQLSDVWTLKNIASYRRDEAITPPPSDLDLSPIPTIEQGIAPSKITPIYAVTDELQFLYKSSSLAGVIGSFNSWNGVVDDANPLYSRVLGTVSANSSDAGGHGHGLYANATYQLGRVPGLSITGGIRFNRDYQDVTNCTYTTEGVRLTCESRNGNWDATSHTLGVQYQASESTLLYITNSNGARSGGFNPLGSPPGREEFDPESLNMIEAGIKTHFDMLGSPTRIAFALWRGWYDDIQVPDSVIGRDPQGNPQQTIFTSNAAKADIQGFEAELAVRLMSRLTLSGGVNYNDNEFSDYEIGGQDLTGSSFTYAPEWQYNVGADLILPFPERLGAISFSANYMYTGRRATVTTFPPTPENDVLPNDVVNLSLNWHEILGSRVRARLTVTNATDSEKGVSTLPFWSSFGYVSTAAPRPREFTLALGYDF